MEYNSIKQNLNKEDIISEIRLMLDADINKQQLFIIVEGEDDIRFWKSLITSADVFLYESYDGKCGIEKIINNHFLNKYQVFGIRDRDYEINLQCQQILFYDHCCMEMMLIKSEPTFNKVTSEYYKGPLEDIVLRHSILNQLKVLSLMRKDNEILKQAIKFRGVSLNNAFCTNENKIDNLKLIANIHEINKCNFLYTEADIIALEQRLLNETELLDITQGHDFSTLMACICSLYLKGGIPYTAIESGLRCSFSFTEFKKTILYNSINDYTDLHKLISCFAT